MLKNKLRQCWEQNLVWVEEYDITFGWSKDGTLPSAGRSGRCVCYLTRSSEVWGCLLIDKQQYCMGALAAWAAMLYEEKCYLHCTSGKKGHELLSLWVWNNYHTKHCKLSGWTNRHLLSQFWMLEVQNVPSEGCGEEYVPCLSLHFWWLSGNLRLSLACKSITPISDFICTWHSPCMYLCPHFPFL